MQHNEIADGNLNGLAVLIQRSRFHFDQSLVRSGLRRPYFKHLALDAQLIAWPNRSRPAEIVEAGADDTASRFEFAFDQ